MYVEFLNNYQGYFERIIDFSGKAKGVYFLEITTDRGGINKKIVLQ